MTRDKLAAIARAASLAKTYLEDGAPASALRVLQGQEDLTTFERELDLDAYDDEEVAGERHPR
jgi:hypothetical protein